MSENIITDHKVQIWDINQKNAYDLFCFVKFKATKNVFIRGTLL